MILKRYKSLKFSILISLILLFSFFIEIISPSTSNILLKENSKSNETSMFFNSSYAYSLIEDQMACGNRIPSSLGIEKARKLIALQLEDTFNIKYQNFTPSNAWNTHNIELINIVAEPKLFDSNEEFFILMAHYDTREYADHDPDTSKRKLPVPGANDGASGVAIIIALGKALIQHNIHNFRLLFFDGEDQGSINNWPWIVGSNHYVNTYEENKSKISFGILLDIVGGFDATFKKERNSFNNAPDLVNHIWETGSENFSQYFIDEIGSSITDDHIPFLNNKIPVVDIIDNLHRYDAWHTTYDDMGQIDIKTIEAVGYTCEIAITTMIFENLIITYVSSLVNINFYLILVLILGKKIPKMKLKVSFRSRDR